MKSQESIYKQHSENNEWTEKLNFYKDELNILKNRLAEIASKNTNKEVLAEVEHFQNQFIIQRNNIDEIAHLVKINEENLQKEIKSNPVAVDHRKTEYHQNEKNQVESFETNFNDLRSKFKVFTTKHI
jgi:hypothetical protein